MVDWTVTVGGTTISAIFDVQYDRGTTDELGEATIVCANNTNNRSVESGDEVVVQKNGVIDFRGYVTGKPTKAGASATEIEIKAVDKRMELKHQQIRRVFYQMDTGEIVRHAINLKTLPFSFDEDPPGNFIHRGDDITDWTTNIPKFSLGGIVSVTLEEAGNDFVFFGWPSGSSGTYQCTYRSVPYDAIPGNGRVDTLYIRLAVNNKGGVFSCEVDLRDDFGNNYIWPVELPETGFEVYELKAEDATPVADIGDHVEEDSSLQIRLETDGSLPDSRAMAFDYAKVIPFATELRDTDIETYGVQDTGNVVTRRIEENAFQMIKDFATEDQFFSHLDLDGVLHYEPEGQRRADPINYDTTPVTNAEFNRDYKDITNRVVVQGSGDIQYAVEDTESIEFYGVSAREKPIVDSKIKTEAEAKRRGEGYIKENAWDDNAIEFEIADSDYKSLRIGDDIYVDWPPEDIIGTFTVSNVETDKHGIVTVSLTNRGAI